jgi:prepilin-type N-terminal cleavage/methylation domain-containing protein
MREKIHNARKIKKEQGFTLMELLIVIIILGFLLGMIMPRLSEVVSGDAIDNVCDTNNKGMRQYTNMMLQRQGHLPNGLTNLVNHDGASYYPLSVSDGNPNNDPEALAGEFFERNAMGMHPLSADEADEIKGELGISYVHNLNFDQEDKNGTSNGLNRPLEEVDIDAGVGVAMVGVGDYLDAGNQAVTGAANTLTSDPTTWDGSTTTVFPQGNPYWLGRIVMGIGKNSELVTNGYIQAAALCPGGIQNADNVAFNNYCLVLPRLQATIDDGVVSSGVTEGEDVIFVDASDTANGEQVSMKWEAQPAWQFEFTCPEGHKWPDNDNDYWVINP